MLFKFYQFFLSIANVICGSEAVKRCDTNYLNMSDFELIYKLKAKLLVLHSKEALSEHVAAFFTQFFHDVDLLYTIIEKLNKINYQKSARKI